MMVGGILFAVGLFIFGWTSGKNIHWIAYAIISSSTRVFVLLLTTFQTVYRRRAHRSRLFDDFSMLTQLHHRHIPTLCRERCRCRHVPQERFRRRISVVRSTQYVPIPSLYYLGE